MAPTPLFRSPGIFPVDRVARIMIMIVVNPLTIKGIGSDDYSSRYRVQILPRMSFFSFFFLVVILTLLELYLKQIDKRNINRIIR